MKVEPVEELGAGTSSTSTGQTEQETASASTLIEEDDGTQDACEEASDKAVRQEANKLVKNARADVHAATIDVRKAEAALRHEQRRAEERDKRWWAAEQRYPLGRCYPGG